jgi:hypothetical protein
MCGDTGWMVFPAVKNWVEKKWFLNPMSTHKAAIPCLCTAGQEKPQGYDRQIQKKVFEYKKATLKERTEKSISYKEGIAKVKEFLGKKDQAMKEKHRAKIQNQIVEFMEERK